MTRLIWLALVAALMTGCGSGAGGGSDTGGSGTGGGNSQPPAQGPTTATVALYTQGPPATIVYGVQFVLHLPVGAMVAATPDGDLLPGVLQAADGRALAGGSYVPATAAEKGYVKVLIADTSGFPVGSLATINCTVTSPATFDPAGFTVDDFSAPDNPGITPGFTVATK
jgi:hypothetical protein